jgi:deoxyribodipyrimidine photolyase
MIKKYLQFIKEADETIEAKSTDKSQDSGKYTELKDEVKSMIEKTIEKNGGEFKSFVDKLSKSPDDTKIEGFINDSDIYEFYLKFRNDIDELLNNVKYFNQVPSESNTFGLYDYIIKGTEKAVLEIVKEL